MKQIQVLLTLLLFFIVNTYSSSTGDNVKIVKLMVDDDYDNGGLLFIKVEPTPTNQPACHNNSYDYTLDLSSTYSDQWLSMLLTFHSTVENLKVEGKGGCYEFSTVETLERIEVK